jgi:hypothetical protein
MTNSPAPLAIRHIDHTRLHALEARAELIVAQPHEEGPAAQNGYRDPTPRIEPPQHNDVRSPLWVVAIGTVCLAAVPLAFADSVVAEHQSCPVSTSQAHSLADRLYEQGSYQPAGECYLAAGDYDRANRAFAKAVGPASTATARQLTQQGEQAKTMLHNVQIAFASHH